MEQSIWYLIVLISLVFSAFFSGMEIAFITSDKLSIAVEKNRGVRARIISIFVKNPSRFIGVLLLGNNVSLVLFGIASANILEPLIIEHITSSEAIILLVQTIITTLIVLAFAEFLPKTVFRINPNSALTNLAYPGAFIYYILWIPMMITIGISELILKLFTNGTYRENAEAFNRIDLHRYVKDSTQRAKDKEDLDHEVHIFENAIDFKNKKTRDCMIPRTEIVALNIDESIETLRTKFVETGLSKILIYRDTIDNIIGYAHSSELFKQPETIKSILLPISIFPESKSAQDVLEELTHQKRSIGVVLDEFGGTSGIVTIEDVMEEIFGEIEDEHDSEELIEEVSNGIYLLSARQEVDYLNQKYNLNIPVHDEYETLAGFILHQTETIPSVGESILTDHFDIKIIKASHTRIETVKLSIKEES